MRAHVLLLSILIGATAALAATKAPLRAQSHESAGLDRLVRAYPAELTGHDARFIFWRDGTKMPVGTLHKSFEERLRNASILDQMWLPYPKGRLHRPPGRDDDPGRFRNQAFFDKMYGNCRKGEVQRHLGTITWLPRSWGHHLRVTSINGVANKLRAISAAIEALPGRLRRFAFPSAGTFNCRTVKDTGRPSMHAYGAAIDLNTRFADYWLWRPHAAYRNRMPYEIVRIFERYGFIWGGKWNHYDTMHFEYRPELL